MGNLWPPPNTFFCVHHIYAAVFPLCEQVIVNEDCASRGPRLSGLAREENTCCLVQWGYYCSLFALPLLLRSLPHSVFLFISVFQRGVIVCYIVGLDDALPPVDFILAAFSFFSSWSCREGKAFRVTRHDCICNLIRSSVSHCLFLAPLLRWFDNRNKGSQVLQGLVQIHKLQNQAILTFKV